MIIERLARVEHEPLMMKLIPGEGTGLRQAGVESYIDGWLSRREAHPQCSNLCPRKLLDVQEVGNGSLLVLVQWLCEECLPVLAEDLSKRFPDIAVIQIGIADTPYLDSRGFEFRRYDSRRVTFEDGRIELVDTFEISNRAVSVAEMRTFCVETGYVTSAQKRRDLHNYESNPFVSALEMKDIEQADARLLSYIDAMAYCHWRGFRLPTEGEYLAAALVDDMVHDLTPNEIRQLFLTADVVRFTGFAITAESVGEIIVCRSGPRIIKRPLWEKDIARNRYLVSKDQPSGQLFPCR